MGYGLLDAWGQSVEQQKFADKLISSVNKDVFGMTDEELRDPSTLDRRKGLVVQLKDKKIGVFTEFEGFDADIWMEDDRDIMMQLYPPRGRAQFPSLDVFLEAIEKPFARVFDAVCNVKAEYYAYGMERPHRVTLKHDSRRRGMDLLELRLAELYKNLGWHTFMVDVLKECQKEMRRVAESRAV